MNRQLFYQYLDNPNQLDEESLKHLNELVAEYPYFQAGRMLLVKNLGLLSHIRYNIELKKAAAHIADRRQLYFLVHSPLAEPVLANATKHEMQALVAETIDDPMVENTVSMAQNETVAEVDKPLETIAPFVEETEQSVGTEAIPSMDNYFDVSDVIDLDEGFTIDFSKSLKKQPEPEIEILPTADLLDYELNTSAFYDLNDELETPFDPNQTQPFSMWLKALRHPVQPAEPSKTQPATIDKQMMIIENFLQKGRDRIAPNKAEANETNEDISTRSVEESDALMTETLANIHIKQKQYEKAIVIFEKLSLKYPEKSIYFAARITDTERLISNL